MINTTLFSGNIRVNKNFQQNHNNKTPLNATRLAFGSEYFKSIYEPSDKITQALKANTLSFKGGNSGTGLAHMELPKDSPFDFNDIGELLSIIMGNEKLVKDMTTLMKPLKDFKGRHLVKTVKAIIQHPEKKPLVAKLIDKFKDNCTFNLSQDLTEVICTYNPENNIHREVLTMAMSIKRINSADDIVHLLKITNKDNLPIMKKVVEKAKDNEIINSIELKDISNEVIKDPSKEPVLNKLLNFMQPVDDNRTKFNLSGTLEILELFEPDNPVHNEMLDFFLSCNKGLWGLVIAQFMEMTTADNKEAIKQIVNKASGTGMEAAKEIMTKIKELSST